MNAFAHTDSDVEEMAQELPIRSDLARMPLDPDPGTAKAQLLIRQAVPVPFHEMLVNQIKDLLGPLLRMKKK